MIQVLGSMRQILAWGQAGEFAKVVNEMGLIVVAARKRNIGPIDLALAMHGLEYPLEASHAAERLWFEAHLFVKNLNKAALTQTDLAEDICNADVMRPGAELPPCKPDRWMQFERPDQSRQQILRGQREHGIDRLFFKQPVAELACGMWPEIIQVRRRILQFAARDAEKRKGATGLELNSEHAVFLRCVDDKTTGSRAGEDRTAVRLIVREIVRVIDPHRFVSKIEDDTRLAVGHQPLFRMSLRRALPIPEAFDE